MQAGLQQLLNALPPFLRIPALIAAALLLGWILAKVMLVLVFWNLRRWNPAVTKMTREHLGMPLSYLGPVLTASLLWSADLVPEEAPAYWGKLLAILLIVLLAWVLLRAIDLVAAIIMRRFDLQETDNLDERKIITQLQYIRQVAAVILVILALAMILLQFDGVRKIGAGILTSAGVLGIIVGFAAQRSIANLLAGFQIAFTQPIRIDDVVIIEGEWGRVEEITLTYVVVKIWDQRRLVVPLQYFIDKAFQNWTRTTSELTGAVFLYLDYTFPVEAIRTELEKYLKAHPLWDQRVMAVQVTDARPEVMEVRMLVSAANAGNTFDLRCDLREHMIRFVQEQYPQSLPMARVHFQQEKTGKTTRNDAFCTFGRNNSIEMLYPITRPMAALALKANYRKIILSHTERIPKDKAVILAANHPTAFIEPCILACFLNRPLYFLVRGDFFKKPFYEKLLRNLHMLPVYRMRDGGFTNIKQNYATFESCFRALKEHKTIMILAEGRTIHEKRLRPLSKGPARIALGALDKHPEIGEVYIVPVGVNYTYADQPRSEVMIEFGEPMQVSHYLAEYNEQPNQAITSLTDELRSRMLQHIVVIDDPRDEELTERLLVMHRSDQPETRFPILQKHPQRLQMELSVSRKVNEISEEQKNQLWSWLDRYFEKLDKLNLQDELISRQYLRPGGLQGLMLAAAFPLFALGYIWSFPPLWLARFIVDKNVRHVEFYEPVRIASGIGAFLGWTVLWLWLFSSLFSFGWGVLAVAGLFLLSYFAVVYREQYAAWQLFRRLDKLPEGVLNGLREDRSRILSYFQQLENTQPAGGA